MGGVIVRRVIVSVKYRDSELVTYGLNQSCVHEDDKSGYGRENYVGYKLSGILPLIATFTKKMTLCKCVLWFSLSLQP